MITALGLLAAFCTTVAYLPQVIHTWRSRSTKDLSLPMLLVLTAGLAFWLAYGLIIRDAPLIFANSITFALTGTILYFKLRHG